MRSQSEALSSRISTFKFGGHNSACDSVVDPKRGPNVEFDEVGGGKEGRTGP